MCIVSAIGDHYRDRWYPQPTPYPVPTVIPDVRKTIETLVIKEGEVTREEFDELRRQVEECHELLKVGKAYDERNGEPDCEIDDKVAFIKKVAEAVGVDLRDVFGGEPSQD